MLDHQNYLEHILAVDNKHQKALYDDGAVKNRDTLDRTRLSFSAHEHAESLLTDISSLPDVYEHSESLLTAVGSLPDVQSTS